MTSASNSWIPGFAGITSRYFAFINRDRRKYPPQNPRANSRRPQLMPYSHFADLPANIRDRAARVKLAVFDVDGVLTDGKLWFTDEGRELSLRRQHGIRIMLDELCRSLHEGHRYLTQRQG